MREGWGRMMKDEWRIMKDDDFKLLRGFDDGQTTFVNVEFATEQAEKLKSCEMIDDVG